MDRELFPTEGVTTVSKLTRGKMSRETVIAWCKRGKIPGAYNNGTWQIPRAAIEGEALKALVVKKGEKWRVTI